MKKVKFYSVILIGLILLVVSGCGKEKKLVCTQNTSGVDITFNIGFKGNTIQSMDFSYDMDLSKYNDTQIAAVEKQDFCSIVKTSMSEYKDAFNECKQTIEEKHLKVNADLEVDKIAKNFLQKMSSPEDSKTELEKQGYSCTIE